MGQWWALLGALPFVAFLLLSGGWAERLFRQFPELPGHFDFSERAYRMTPRRTITLILPILFAVLLLVFTFAAIAIPPEYRKGDPVAGMLVCGSAIVGAQRLFYG